jgi:hypothetical protein
MGGNMKCLIKEKKLQRQKGDISKLDGETGRNRNIYK